MRLGVIADRLVLATGLAVDLERASNGIVQSDTERLR